MISFYIVRGKDHDFLINLSRLEKALYYESMLKFQRDEREKLEAMFGKGDD